MTWAQDQRIAFIKERIDAGQTVNRADLRDKFFVTIQTASATFRAFERKYPGLMRYCARTKAMVPASWVPDGEVDWRSRALAVEAAIRDWLKVKRDWLDFDGDRRGIGHALCETENALCAVVGEAEIHDLED